MDDLRDSYYYQQGQTMVASIPGPRIYKLWSTRSASEKNLEPEIYLGAVAELLFGTIVTSFFITFIYDEVYGTTMITDNPIRNMVGYNNPCAFWDQAPALYFASLMFCPMVYFAFRYANLDTLRAELVWKNTFGESTGCNIMAVANWTYCLSQCLVMGIFVITPIVHHTLQDADELDKMHLKMRLHSACFLQLVPCLCMTISGNYYEGYRTGQPSKYGAWFAIRFYIIATILETVFATIAIFGYQGRFLKDEPQFYIFPPWFMQTIDYCWFVSLPIVTTCSPQAQNVILDFKLAAEEAPNPETVGYDESAQG